MRLSVVIGQPGALPWQRVEHRLPAIICSPHCPAFPLFLSFISIGSRRPPSPTRWRCTKVWSMKHHPPGMFHHFPLALSRPFHSAHLSLPLSRFRFIRFDKQTHQSIALLMLYFNSFKFNLIGLTVGPQNADEMPRKMALTRLCKLSAERFNRWLCNQKKSYRTS